MIIIIKYPVDNRYGGGRVEHSWSKIQMLLTPALLCHKDTAQGMQNPPQSPLSCHNNTSKGTKCPNACNFACHEVCCYGIDLGACIVRFNQWEQWECSTLHDMSLYGVCALCLACCCGGDNTDWQRWQCNVMSSNQFVLTARLYISTYIVSHCHIPPHHLQLRTILYNCGLI